MAGIIRVAVFAAVVAGAAARGAEPAAAAKPPAPNAGAPLPIGSVWSGTYTLQRQVKPKRPKKNDPHTETDNLNMHLRIDDCKLSEKSKHKVVPQYDYEATVTLSNGGKQRLTEWIWTVKGTVTGGKMTMTIANVAKKPQRKNLYVPAGESEGATSLSKDKQTITGGGPRKNAQETSSFSITREVVAAAAPPAAGQAPPGDSDDVADDGGGRKKPPKRRRPRRRAAEQ
jgi:hypothetical protein